MSQCQCLSSYGAPVAQRASYLALHSSLFSAVNYDYIVTNRMKFFLIVFLMVHTLTNVEPILSMLQKSGQFTIIG